MCMEMISAKAITFRSRRTGELWETAPEEKPVSLQIFGHEPDVMAEACRILEDQTFDILDINMGCPVPKIVGNQEGSALMRDPSLIEKVVRACVDNSSRPVTVKIRKGFDADHVNAVECALAAQEGGASAVAVHGRTREQMYSGEADWSVIADVKRALTIPVIGNGDVVDGPSAKRMMDETGCDAVMIARAAQGNPWIFREVNAYLENGTILERPPRREIVKMILRHAQMLCECKGERVGMLQGRESWNARDERPCSQLSDRLPGSLQSEEESELDHYFGRAADAPRQRISVCLTMMLILLYNSVSMKNRQWF